jgi:hypothetical protein
MEKFDTYDQLNYNIFNAKNMNRSYCPVSLNPRVKKYDCNCDSSQSIPDIKTPTYYIPSNNMTTNIGDMYNSIYNTKPKIVEGFKRGDICCNNNYVCNNTK